MVRTHRNNKGFTLVELMLAMTILAIIVVPLLRAFVMGSLTNSKASKIQRATNCAQNLIENLKGTTVSDLALSVYGYTADENGREVSAFPLSSFGSYVPFEAEIGAAGLYTETNDPCVEAASLGGKFLSPTSAEEVLCFVFPNIEQNGRNYDAVLKLTPGKTSEGVDVSEMSGRNCIYLAQPDNQADEAAANFMTANQAYASRSVTLDKNQFAERMSRSITLDITTTGSGVMVSMKAVYDCGAGYTASDRRRYTVSESSLHDSAEGDLSSIYLFYYPLYANGYARDSIVINNRENIDVNVYLVAMEDTEYTEAKAAIYKANLTVNERLLQSEYQGSNARTGLHTTLFSNVENDRWSLSDGNSFVSTRVKGLNEGTESTFMYRMTVYIYEHDDDVFQKTSGKSRFAALEENFITSFDGSALD